MSTVLELHHNPTIDCAKARCTKFSAGIRFRGVQCHGNTLKSFNLTGVRGIKRSRRGEEEWNGEGLARRIICSCCCPVAEAEGVVGEGSSSYRAVYEQVVFCELCGGGWEGMQ